jgi:hypothetical protein
MRNTRTQLELSAITLGSIFGSALGNVFGQARSPAHAQATSDALHDLQRRQQAAMRELGITSRSQALKRH